LEHNAGMNPVGTPTKAFWSPIMVSFVCANAMHRRKVSFAVVVGSNRTDKLLLLNSSVSLPMKTTDGWGTS